MTGAFPLGSPGQVSALSTIETHISQLFLTADRVYKLLKPVSYPFLDFTDTDRRLAAGRKEFELNAAISPDVYLGLTDIVEHGRVVDHLIVMRRLPAERQLDHLVSSVDFSAHIAAVARRIGALHASSLPITDARADAASVEAVRKNWLDNLAVVEQAVGPIISAADFAEVTELSSEFLAGRAPLFAERIADGWVRDGHGDLRAEHVFVVDGGPRIIDCLAFRDDLRIGDVLADIGFLAMDLHRLAGVDAAIQLLQEYHRFTNEHHPSMLAHHYVAYRAHVRAKIECIRFAEGDLQAASEVARYHALALQHLRHSRVRLVLVGGGAGVGKSTVASGVADRLGAVWIRSDDIRKELAGVAPDVHLFDAPGKGWYSDDITDQVYSTMLERAALLIGRGTSVVLDATWSDAAHRVWARDCANVGCAALTELHCELAPAIARERIARRLSSLHEPSDATPEIADHIAGRFVPWPEAECIDTAQSIERTVADACLVVLRRNKPAEQPPATAKPAVDLLEMGAWLDAALDGPNPATH